MMAEEVEAANNQDPPEHPPPFDSECVVDCLQQSFKCLSQAVVTGDLDESNASIDSLAQIIDAVSNSALSNPENDTAHSNAVAVLLQIQSYISDPSLSQGILDALSFELPKGIAKLAGVSQRCSEIVESVIEQFTEKCSPRDMITIIGEALSCYGKTTDAPGFIPSLLHGLSKAFLSIRRRQFEMVKAAVPGILNALKVAASDFDDRSDTRDMFKKAICLAISIQSICENLESRVSEQLRALLGLFVLQIMALVSISMGNEVSSCFDLVLQLLLFFPYCGFSYIDLLTGRETDRISALVSSDSDDYMDDFSYVKCGAVLSVIWGHISDEAARVAEQDMSMLKDRIQSIQIERWKAIGMLKYILYVKELPWTLKGHAIDFILFLTGRANQLDIDEHIICSVQIPCLRPALEAIMMVIMCAPDATVRKSSLTALKQVLADIPGSFRVDMLRALVRNSGASSMTGILLDCIREFLRSEYSERKLGRVVKEEGSSSLLWCADVLELVEVVLRPPDGGPPSLPEQCDAVSSALNLYRYVLLMESTGKTNYTGVLTKSNLQRAYYEWLLPLRTLVAGISMESGNHCDQLAAADTVCALNPIEFVLYRNIELVEETMKGL